MKIKILKVKTYNLDELSEEAKQKAIETMSDINVDYDSWNEHIMDEWKEKLENLGYISPSIFYSGFGSQGDGACFIAIVDIDKWLKAHKLSNKYRKLYNHSEEVSIKITHNYRYYFATSTTVYGENYTYNDDIGLQMDQVVELIEAEREELGNAIYKELEKEYEYQTSKEAVTETIKANEYEFLESGKRQLYI